MVNLRVEGWMDGAPKEAAYGEIDLRLRCFESLREQRRASGCIADHAMGPSMCAAKRCGAED